MKLDSDNPTYVPSDLVPQIIAKLNSLKHVSIEKVFAPMAALKLDVHGTVAVAPPAMQTTSPPPPTIESDPTVALI